MYGDVEIDRNKHIHKKRKLAEGREKTMVILSDMIITGLYVCGLLEMNVKYSFGAKLIKLRSFNYNYCVNQWFSTGGDFAPQGHLAVSEDTF